MAASKAAPNAATDSQIGGTTQASTGLHHFATSSQPVHYNSTAGATGEELEQQIEAMFDKADDLMINQEKFNEAVSFNIKLFRFIFSFVWLFYLLTSFDI